MLQKSGYIASGNPLQDDTDIIEILKTKFCDKKNSSYNVKEIDESKVEALWAKMRLKKISSTDSSASFQMLCFKPNCEVFSAAPYLCTCDECLLVDYGSCDLFSNYKIDTHQLREVSLWSHNTEATDNFFLPVFIAAESSLDTVWLMKITNNTDITNDLIRDSYGNCVLAGQHWLKGCFSEKDNMVKNGYIYIVNKKHFTIFFKQSLL